MPARRFPFVQVDVFTDRAFGGNQLAVFTDARGLSDGEMQAIASEMNYSESTFVVPPASPDHDAQVRIFTVVRELPFAGHPVVGTAFVLAAQRSARAFTFELGVGPLAVTADPGDGRSGRARMQQPLPRFEPAWGDPATLAALVGLGPEELLPDVPPEIGSSGVEFLYLPLRSLEAVRRARGDEAAIRRYFDGRGHPAVYLFSLETIQPTSASHGRMMALTMGPGLGEDPATGGASGPLGAYLVRHGLRPAGRLLLEQGYEMGRPSQIEVDIAAAGDQITAVHVGGGVVRIAEGTLEL